MTPQEALKNLDAVLAELLADKRPMQAEILRQTCAQFIKTIDAAINDQKADQKADKKKAA